MTNESKTAFDNWDHVLGFSHYNDVIMSALASQITSRTIVYSNFYSGADERKHQSSASLAFVREIHRWPVNSPHKRPVTRKMFPFDDVIMKCLLNSKSWNIIWKIILLLYNRHCATVVWKLLFRLCVIATDVRISLWLEVKKLYMKIKKTDYMRQKKYLETNNEGSLRD